MLVSHGLWFPIRSNLLSPTLLLMLTLPVAAKDAVDYIDPFIGTGRQGKDFPAASRPFGMVKVGPDTVTAGPTSYYFSDTAIQGFSFTHLGGADGGELGNLLVMPTTGPLKTYFGQRNKPGTGFLSPFSKTTESASVGYYAVTLADSQIRVEATAALHSGLLRFTFPSNDHSRIQIDLSHRNGGTSLHQTLHAPDDHTLEGQIDCTHDGGGWPYGGGCHYTLYYHLEFSKPLTTCGAWNATLPAGPYNKILNKPEFIKACQDAEVIPGCRDKEGPHIGFYSEFPTKAGEQVLVKAGISFVSLVGARANLAAEIPDWDFDKVHRGARDAWSAALDRLRVEGGTEDHKTIFCSALYRSMLFPQIDQDFDGNYPGGDNAPHQAEGFINRTIFSGWDVYRSEYPLLTLVAPDVVNDQINSMVHLAATNGTHYFDRWEIMGCYTGCMIGNPEVVILNDAWQKGIRNFDLPEAYEYAVKTSAKWGNSKYGYCPGQISETTEYGLDEWNMAQLAAILNKPDDVKAYTALSQAYRKIYDPQAPWTYDADGKNARPDWHGWMRARDAKGQFLPWLGLVDPKTTREATVFQAGWTACNDIPGMIELFGGKDLFVAKLDDFFSRSPDFTKWNPYLGTKNPYHIYTGGEPWWNPYNNPTNEPTELIPFLFNRAGAPWLTQKWVQQSENVYLSGPEGLPGDDDTGQMSAWYVLCASGLHQACPGDPRFELFTPLFDRVTLRTDPHYASGRPFTIISENTGAGNIYIQSATLNGQPLNHCWLDYHDIAIGGELRLILGAVPNRTWGQQP